MWLLMVVQKKQKRRREIDSLNWGNMVTGQATSFSCLFSLQFGEIDFLWALMKILGPHQKIFSPSLLNKPHLFLFPLIYFPISIFHLQPNIPYCDYWTIKKQKKCINIRKVMLVDNLVFDFELIVSFVYLVVIEGMKILFLNPNQKWSYKWTKIFINNLGSADKPSKLQQNGSLIDSNGIKQILMGHSSPKLMRLTLAWWFVTHRDKSRWQCQKLFLLDVLSLCV